MSIVNDALRFSFKWKTTDIFIPKHLYILSVIEGDSTPYMFETNNFVFVFLPPCTRLVHFRMVTNK